LNYSDRDIKFLKGVGPTRALLFNKELNIRSVEDLLHHFPYKYVDRSRFYKISEIDGQMPYIQLRGRIEIFNTLGEGRGKRLIAIFSDDTGSIELVWFKGIKYITDKYRRGEEYVVFGKPTVFGSRFNIAHPEIETVDEVTRYGNRLQPHYTTSEKMKSSYLTSKAIHKVLSGLLESLRDYSETLSPMLRKRLRLMDINEAFHQIHNPTSPSLLRDAQYRFKFEELFYLQLSILQRAAHRREKVRGHIFTKVGEKFHAFYEQKLPFELTNAQKKVMKEIRDDFRTGKQMNRLLQGDVGSGKTLVALMAMLIALDNGFQAALMAPTEILATQHYETLKSMLDGLGINIALLSGSTKKKARTLIDAGLRSGEIHFVVGTHALIEDKVLFQHLGLAIIDEQHRFGVAQRARLWDKGEAIAPHILVMTATPIPRTLAMTLYGDLSVSVIDELPPGRKPIQTLHMYDGQRAGLYQSIRKQVELGRQVYIVYPLIKESENFDFKNLEEGFVNIQKIFPEYTIRMVHGKMKPAEKEAQMADFVNGKAQILLSTTVIEVGVNVPNASVMLIENAERFGLSQLHQLRGRVGRGADQSYCILVTSGGISEETKRRVEVMTSTNDGFEIAEADLKIRGPGDLEGTQQSGISINLRIANLAKDGEILQLARDIAEEILAVDPTLTLDGNTVFRIRLKTLFEKEVEWGQIS